jgi:hypothetical protein
MIGDGRLDHANGGEQLYEKRAKKTMNGRHLSDRLQNGSQNKFLTIYTKAVGVKYCKKGVFGFFPCSAYKWLVVFRKGIRKTNEKFNNKRQSAI